MLDKTSPPSQCIDLAKGFVDLLTGSPDTVMRLRFIHDSERNANQTAEREGTISQLWPDIVERQHQGYGVFYFMNTVRPGAGSGKGGCAEDIDVNDDCRLLATDHDDGLPTAEWEWHLHPCIIVQTSRVFIDGHDIQKGQALWPVTDLPKSDFKPAQRRLAVHYGTDTSISNPSRVLRLPGTLHLKDPTSPQLVTFEDCSDPWIAGCKLADVMRGLPELPPTGDTSAAIGTTVAAEHLRMLLGYIDPDAPYPEWRDTVAAIRATPIADDTDESERRQIACEWSRGLLNRDNRFKDAPPSRYTDNEAVNKVFDSMPPREGGVTFGTIYHAAKAAGYDGPPSPRSAAEVFGDYIEARNDDPKGAASRGPFLLTEDDLFAWPDPEELVSGFIMCGENICLFGQPKVGKTFIALDLALSIAADQPVFERLPVRKTGAVVYLSGEGHAGMKRRIKAWRQARSISKERRLPFYYKAEVPSTAAGMEECKRYVDGIRKQLGGEPVLIVIDTMARSMSGLNENDAGDVGRYLALTEGLRSGLNCPVLTLAHSGKDETKGIRGSNASTAGFDAIWVAEMNEANRTVKISSKWLKDAEDLGPFCFRLKHVQVQDMRLGKGAVLEFVPLDEFNRTADGLDPLVPSKVRAALAELGAIGRDHPVTSQVLLERLVPRLETETDIERRTILRNFSRRLSERASGRCKPWLSLERYAHKGKGARAATLWCLPADRATPC
jgi:hypothetical protein